MRDRLLLKYGELLRAGGSFEEAKRVASELLPEIEKSAEEWIRELGFDYGVTATLTEEWYETREYESFSLPAGYYTSLRVIIGEGAGKNWWCVMYPPLCMELASEDAPRDDGVIDYTNEEITLITSGKYTSTSLAIRSGIAMISALGTNAISSIVRVAPLSAFILKVVIVSAEVSHSATPANSPFILTFT